MDDALQSKFENADFQSNAYRIYTSLDLRLQRAAAEAIRDGMQNVDDQIKKQRRFRGQTPPEAQVALIALDPHTGEIKALSGGRNYGVSQLNHILAKRQPGSIFKPFVYAAAMKRGCRIRERKKVITPSTIVNVDPTTFYYDGGKEYSPRNFDKNEGGDMTLREALAHWVNVAAVRVAEMVGYQKVVDVARAAGMNDKIEPTPAVALGSYEITLLEAAGAYTIFSNGGMLLKPSFISSVRSQDGASIYRNKVETKKALDPRVAYLLSDMMEEVLRSGTAAGVRGKYGFTVPAAGKTGTSFDGWFAGYTSELLCIVWVGFDDNRELELEGAHSAAPISGAVHEEGALVSRIPRRQAIPRACGHRQRNHRSAERHAGDVAVPRPAVGSLHRWKRTGAGLPDPRRTDYHHDGLRLEYRADSATGGKCRAGCSGAARVAADSARPNAGASDPAASAGASKPAGQEGVVAADLRTPKRRVAGFSTRFRGVVK